MMKYHFQRVFFSIFILVLLQTAFVGAAPVGELYRTTLEKTPAQQTPLQKLIPPYLSKRAVEALLDQNQTIYTPGSLPASGYVKKSVVAGMQTNGQMFCIAGERWPDDYILPSYVLNNSVYNDRSFSGNYLVGYDYLLVRTFSMKMDKTDLYCVHGSYTDVELMPDGIGFHYHLNVIDCHDLNGAKDCKAPYNAGIPSVTDFHRSGLNDTRFEFHSLNNIPGCSGENDAYELMVDMCGKEEGHWVKSDNYRQGANMYSLPLINFNYPKEKRYSGVLKKTPDGSVCAIDRMLNTVSPNFTRQIHKIDDNEEICIDIPKNPLATQYILATPKHSEGADEVEGPEGRCSCNLINDDYLKRCICQTGTPRLNRLESGNVQVCFTNKNNALDDSVIFFTKDTDSDQETYKCNTHRRDSYPSFYEDSRTIHNSLFLEEHRINPAFL